MEEVKQNLPPFLSALSIPWTGAPSGGDNPLDAGKKIRKYAVDLIMKLLREKHMDQQFTRPLVEAEYDKRIRK
jgi:hypothetical protein